MFGYEEDLQSKIEELKEKLIQAKVFYFLLGFLVGGLFGIITMMCL